MPYNLPWNCTRTRYTHTLPPFMAYRVANKPDKRSFYHQEEDTMIREESDALAVGLAILDRSFARMNALRDEINCRFAERTGDIWLIVVEKAQAAANLLAV